MILFWDIQALEVMLLMINKRLKKNRKEEKYSYKGSKKETIKIFKFNSFNYFDFNNLLIFFTQLINKIKFNIIYFVKFIVVSYNFTVG